jgi:DNA-directed RNA polymerase specialized sigma24 family protein
MNTHPTRDVTETEYAILPLRYALLLSDHLRDNKPYAEIAVGHNLPIGTVRSRINRARARIAKVREGAAA